MNVCSFFFFSSRRRHTRSDRDWSSDVCSSDLNDGGGGGRRTPSFPTIWATSKKHSRTCGPTGCKNGRGSWRERGEISVGAVSFKKKTTRILGGETARRHTAPPKTEDSHTPPDG